MQTMIGRTIRRLQKAEIAQYADELQEIRSALGDIEDALAVAQRARGLPQ